MNIEQRAIILPGTILLIVGPSGSGKTSLTRALLFRVPFLSRCVTVTTRDPRPEETQGEDYYFVSAAQFESLKSNGDLMHCAHTYGESYGIPRSAFSGLCDKALIVTGSAAVALRRQLPNSISIFIQPKSAGQAAARILERNCPNSESRIADYEEDRMAAVHCDKVFVNANFEVTLQAIEHFYLRERRRGLTPRTLCPSTTPQRVSSGPTLCETHTRAVGLLV
jgi:guanylate kinase